MKCGIFTLLEAAATSFRDEQRGKKAITQSCVAGRMGRKFRLHHKKKKYGMTSLVVSIPRSAVSVMKISIPLDALPTPGDADDVTSLPISLSLPLYTAGIVKSLDSLQGRILRAGLLPPGWIVSAGPVEVAVTGQLAFCKLRIRSPGSAPDVEFCLQVSDDFSWKAYFFGKELQRESTILEDTPLSLTTAEDVASIVDSMTSSRPCQGSPDDRFMALLPSRKGVLRDPTGQHVVAYEDKGTLDYPTIRHSECELLLPHASSRSRCSSCTKYRKTLRSLSSRHMCKERSQLETSRTTSAASHVNYRYLATPEKDQRLRELHSQHRNTTKRLKRVEDKLAVAIEEKGISVDERMHGDLRQIMEECSDMAMSEHPDGSLARVFWEQQLKAASCNDQRQMRWHPLIVKWCLYLRHQSSSAYETLRQSGCLSLPSQRTLRDYTHYTSTMIGFSNEVDQQLMEAADISSLAEYQKCIAIIMDEMHIREGLVYDKHSGALLGFTDLGNVNNLLMEFEHSLASDVPTESLSKTMLVLMVRGLFIRLQFPYAQFACSSVTGDQLFNPFWEGVMRLERCGFMVVVATADGASPNRTFMGLHRDHDSNCFPYKIRNPFASTERYIHFISDPPHLLKTARNCWSSNKRQLWRNGKEIRWRHLQDLYYRDSGAQKSAGGLSLVPKLTYEHIHLTSFSKMRVDLAAQVLSSSVAKALMLSGNPDVTETARFVDMMDKLFDCLNVTSFTAGKRARKPFQDPWRPNDFRFKWLEGEFLPYLESWQSSVQVREGFTVAEQNKMMLSAETRLGLQFTVKSFIGLVRYLFTFPGVKAFLSERISQDPLEKFFGLQRQRGRVNENPNVQEFCKNTQALRVINCTCLNTVKGNCRGSKSKKMTAAELEKESQPLRKRKGARKGRASENVN